MTWIYSEITRQDLTPRLKCLNNQSSADGWVCSKCMKGLEMETIRELASRLEQSISQQEKSTENPPSSKCEKCNGDGFIRVEVSQGICQAVECDCVLEKRVNSRLPLRFKKASLLDFAPAVQERILAWFVRPGDGLFVTGPTGTGKTHLVAAMVRTLLMIRQEAYFRRCADLYTALRECYRVNSSEESVFGNYVRYRYVVLDDLGAGGLSDHERRSTLEVFDQRINQRLPTIVTSNWSIDQIEERMDDRIADRLNSFEPLALQGRSHRGQSA